MSQIKKNKINYLKLCLIACCLIPVSIIYLQTESKGDIIIGTMAIDNGINVIAPFGDDILKIDDAPWGVHEPTKDYMDNYIIAVAWLAANVSIVTFVTIAIYNADGLVATMVEEESNEYHANVHLYGTVGADLYDCVITPDVVPNGVGYYIKITDYNNHSIYGTSDAFTIQYDWDNSIPSYDLFLFVGLIAIITLIGIKKKHRKC